MLDLTYCIFTEALTDAPVYSCAPAEKISLTPSSFQLKKNAPETSDSFFTVHKNFSSPQKTFFVPCGEFSDHSGLRVAVSETAIYTCSRDCSGIVISVGSVFRRKTVKSPLPRRHREKQYYRSSFAGNISRVMRL